VLETPHAVVGAAIATAIPNPFIAIPLAFLSHFVLDMTPHWNPHLNTEKRTYGRITTQTTMIIVGDVVLALVVGGFLAARVLPDSGHAATILLSSFAGVLPDVVEGPYFFLNWKTKFIEKWLKFQKSIQNDAEPFLGLSTQVITLLASFWWIFK
jgi:hypothetical protein